MKFYITKNNQVVRLGDCPEDAIGLQAGEGETLHLGEPQLPPPAPLFDTSWAGGRRREYPPIGDQLDALYHAMDAGVIAMVPAFYDAIKAVKDKYPKV